MSSAPSPSPSTRVWVAMKATKALLGDYWPKLLASRAGEGGDPCGSVYPERTPQQVEDMVFAAEWEPFAHGAVELPCTAYRAKLPGRLGIVALASLPPSTPVYLLDPKGTGTVEACVVAPQGPEVDFTVAILGPEEGTEVCYTFHPGGPIRPSTCRPPEHLTPLDAENAEDLGLTHAKVIPAAPGASAG